MEPMKSASAVISDGRIPAQYLQSTSTRGNVSGSDGSINQQNKYTKANDLCQDPVTFIATVSLEL